MSRKKIPEMPREVWIARNPGPLSFLTWDTIPLLPLGEPPATKYMRADLATEILEALRQAQEAMLIANNLGHGSRLITKALDVTIAVIAKAEGQTP